MVDISLINTLKNQKYYHYHIFLIVLMFVQLLISSHAGYAPLDFTNDPYMASQYVDLYLQGEGGQVNLIFNNSYAPDITLTSNSYKLFASLSVNFDYYITNYQISVSVQIYPIDQTYAQFVIFTNYVQNFYDDLVFNLLIIDQMSPSYPFVWPSVQRFSNTSLNQTSQYVDVSILTFSNQSLNLSNNIAIYSFITGYQIESLDLSFQLMVSSQVLDAITIRVSLSSAVSLISVDLVRIDTLMVDMTQIQASRFIVLDFQTVDYPNDETETITYAYPSNYQNMIVGVSQFYIINQNQFLFWVDWENTYISYPFQQYSEACSFQRIIFSNLNFVSRVCPEGYPYLDINLVLCFDTDCPAGNYRNPTYDPTCQLNDTCYPCQPCQYSCQTCDNPANCLTCNLSNFRYLSLWNSQCKPLPGYYDNGINPVAQPCSSNCATCRNTATYCTSCANNTLCVLNSQCVLCNQSIDGCTTCDNSKSCTLCQNQYFLQQYSCSYWNKVLRIRVNVCYLCAKCHYTCLTCDNNVNCTSCDPSDNRYFDSNTSLCLPIVGYYDDGTNNSVAQSCDYTCLTCDNSANCLTCNISNYRYLSLWSSQCKPLPGYYDNGINPTAQQCSSNCATCRNTATYCTSCANNTLCVLNSQCVLCNQSIDGCTTCDNSKSCTLCQNQYFLQQYSCSYWNKVLRIRVNVCYLCAKCHYTCLTCDNNVNCTSCDPSDNRYFDSNTSLCLPIDGYYDDGTNNSVAQLCDYTCLTCSQSSINCTSCSSLYYFNQTLSQCLLCQDLILDCKYCLNQTVCLQCLSGYPPISDSFCGGYCGDGILNAFDQQCDDGNNLNNNGCSSTCIVQNDFNCTLNGHTSVCIYIGEVFLSINSIIKQANKNQISIQIAYGPSYLLAWTQANFYDMLNTSIPFSNIQIQILTSGQILLILDYLQDIALSTQDFTLSPSSSGLMIFSQTQSTKAFKKMVSSNNQGIYYYSGDIYQLQAIFEIIASLIAILALFGFLLAVFGPKLIGTEMIIVFQLTFLSLMNVGDLNPSFYFLKKLKITMGYSIFSDQQTTQDNNSPFQVRGAPLYSQFLKNYNVIVILILIPLLLGGILNMLVKYSYLQKTNFFSRNKKYIVGQYTFMATAFGACCIFISLFLQILYGIKDITPIIGILSLIFAIIMSIFVLIYTIVLYKKQKIFRNYTYQSFYPKFQNTFCVGTICTSFIICAIMVLGINLQQSLMICTLIFFLIFLFVMVKKPYKGRGNIRSCGNICILMLIWIVLIIYRLQNADFRHKGLGIYVPIIILVLLLICLCFNIPLLIYYLVKNFKNSKQYENIQSQFAKEEILQVKQKIKKSILNETSLSLYEQNNPTQRKAKNQVHNQRQIHTQILKSIPKLNSDRKSTNIQFQYNSIFSQQYQEITIKNSFLQNQTSFLNNKTKRKTNKHNQTIDSFAVQMSNTIYDPNQSVIQNNLSFQKSQKKISVSKQKRNIQESGLIVKADQNYKNLKETKNSETFNNNERNQDDELKQQEAQQIQKRALKTNKISEIGDKYEEIKQQKSQQIQKKRLKTNKISEIGSEYEEIKYLKLQQTQKQEVKMAKSFQVVKNNDNNNKILVNKKESDQHKEENQGKISDPHQNINEIQKQKIEVQVKEESKLMIISKSDININVQDQVQEKGLKLSKTSEAVTRKIIKQREESVQKQIVGQELIKKIKNSQMANYNEAEIQGEEQCNKELNE